MRDSQPAQVTLQFQGAASQVQHQMKRAAMWLRPDGLQTRARRNAWAAMVADQRRQDQAPERDSVRGPAAAAPVMSAQAR